MFENSREEFLQIVCRFFTSSFPNNPRSLSFHVLCQVCVCCIHEEFNWLLFVLKKDSIVAHENCDCICSFCAGGNYKQVFESDMDLSQAGVFTLSFPFQYGTVVCRDAVQLKIHAFFSALVPFSRGEHPIRAVRQ